MNKPEIAKRQTKKRSWLLPLISSLLFSFTVGVYAPIDTYFTLAGEVCFPAWELLPECLLLFAAVFAVCFGLSMLLRGRARNILCALLLGGALALYLQGNFLNMDYGELNGVEIDWSKWGNYGFWNLLYWLLAGLAPLVLLLVFKERFVKCMRSICVGFMALMLLALTMQGLSGAGEPQRNNYAFLYDQPFDLSKNDNIVVFVLDTLDETDVEKYLEDHPEQTERMDGFTFFKNNVSWSVVTKYALPVLLNNRVFDYGESYQEYIDEGWKNSEFFSILKREGYKNYVYADSVYASPDALELVDNAANVKMVTGNHSSMIQQLTCLVAFRYAPHTLKKNLDVNANAEALLSNKKSADGKIYVVWDDTAFFNAVKRQELALTTDEPTFHFYHLRGAHMPYKLSSEGVQTEEGSLGTVMDACFGMLDSYLEQLKSLGVYDDATIVVTADHGNRLMDPNAVLMIKRPNDSGAMKVSSALVSERDVAQTIVSAAGLNGDLTDSEDAFQDVRTEAEQRSYYANWRECLRQYAYRLDEQDELTYDETSLIFTPQGEAIRTYNTYVAGTHVSVNTHQELCEWFALLLDNNVFGEAKDNRTWLGKPDAQFICNFEQQDSGPLRLTLGVSAIIGEQQRVLVMQEGEVLSEAVVHRGDTEVTLELPEDLRSSEMLTFTLRFPDASSELQRNGWVSGDTQFQAVALSYFQLD